MRLRKTTWILAIFTLVLFLGSCRGLVEETGPDQEEAGAYLAFQLGEGGRTVLPSVETTGLTNFVLEGTREGGQRQDLGAWSSYSQFLSATVAVQPGVWRFTLTAQAASSRLAASLAEVVVNVGQNTLHFPLGYTDYGTAGGSGAVEVSLDIPSGGGVVAATGGLYAVMTDSPVENFQDEELHLSGATVHYQKASVPVGQYFLKIKLYADAEKEVLVNTYEELVRVADGSRSVASREIESLNEVYSITYQWNGGGLASGATAPLKFTRHSSITLPTVFEVDKAGCYLLGWYDNAECSGVPITEIVPGTVQNKTLYAKWVQGAAVRSGTVASLDLTAVAGDYHIMVDGSIDSSTIETLQRKFTAAGASAKIHLDLSQTTGLTSIGASAFYGCRGLTSVELPAGVTSIGNGAFYGCSGLTSVTFGESSWLESIDNYAFYGCSGLTSVELPAGVTSIGFNAFNNCTGLTSVYYQGDLDRWCEGFGDDGNYPLMEYCENLYINGELVQGDLVIPAGVTSIGNYAFRDCSGLTSVEIPASVTSISSSAFYGCSGLTSVYYQGDLDRWCEGFGDDGNYPLMEYCENLYINGELVQGDLVIPAGVTSIGNGAFKGCSGLTRVTFGEGSKLESIGHKAFDGCSGLSSMEIPAGVTSIGNYAFRGCSGLTRVTFGEGSRLESIGAFAFDWCRGLSSVEIPASVTSIAFHAFIRCFGLTSVTFGDTSGWYVTTSETDAANKTGGTAVTLSSTNLAANAELVNGTYDTYYWYKVD